MKIILGIFEIVAIVFLTFLIVKHMLAKTKKKAATESILNERLRSILYLSLYLKRPISILLMKPKQTINQRVVQSGIVCEIENGRFEKKTYQRYVGGEFSFGTRNKQGQLIKFSFSDIIAISLTIQQDNTAFLDSKNTVNLIQHLRPVTGFSNSGDNSDESFYYRILSMFSSK